MPGSRWKVRDPSIFPVRYSETVVRAFQTDSPQLLLTTRTRGEAITDLDKFRAWRMCLRHCLNDRLPAVRIEKSHRITARIVPTLVGFDLMVTIKPRNLASLLALNPAILT